MLPRVEGMVGEADRVHVVTVRLVVERRMIKVRCLMRSRGDGGVGSRERGCQGGVLGGWLAILKGPLGSLRLDVVATISSMLQLIGPTTGLLILAVDLHLMDKEQTT
jgi:hypothetical protein